MSQSSELFKYYFNNYVSEEQLKAQQKAYVDQSELKKTPTQLQKRNFTHEQAKNQESPQQPLYSPKYKQIRQQDSPYQAKKVHSSPPAQYSKYTQQKVTEMLKKSDKNPIALLHEYGSRIQRGFIYNFSIKHQRIMAPQLKNQPIDSSSNSAYQISTKPIFQCHISIDKQGILSSGEGQSKKNAKNKAGEIAIFKLLQQDHRAVAILGELLEKQTKNTSMLQKASQQPYGRPYNQQEVKKASQIFPPPPSSSINLSQLLKSEANLLQKLSFFANSLSLNMKWTYKLDRSSCITECRIGILKGVGIHKQKKQAKVIAGKILLKAIDSDPIMKQKFLVYLQEEKKKEVALKPATLDLELTNFSRARKVSKQFKKQLLGSGSRYIDVNLPDIESQVAWVDELDSIIKISEADEDLLRDLFDKTNGLIQDSYKEFQIQMFAVGAFLLDAVRSTNPVGDCYFHIENNPEAIKKSIPTLLDLKTSILAYIKVLQNPELSKINLEIATYRTDETCSEDDTTSEKKLAHTAKNSCDNQGEYLVVSYQGRRPRLHLYMLDLSSTTNIKTEQEDPKSDKGVINSFTAGIFHNNWLIQNFSYTEHVSS